MKFNPSINLILKDGIEIKKYLKKAQKITRVNSS
jgi:hypothetical protein